MLCKVSEWIQRILTVGAAFAGADGAKGLRGLLTAQAENFFRCASLHCSGFAWTLLQCAWTLQTLSREGYYVALFDELLTKRGAIRRECMGGRVDGSPRPARMHSC